MRMKVELTQPRLFRSWRLRVASKLLRVAREAAKDNQHQPNLAVLIRTKNDAKNLTQWFAHIDQERRHYQGRIDVIVVDTESSDDTLQIARAHDATIIRLKQDEFTYPLSINQGLAAVRSDVEIAFVTVGHAFPVLSNCLQAGARHFARATAPGVYGPVLPNYNASKTEKLFFWTASYFIRPPSRVRKVRMGVMGATNCMVRLSAWREHAFEAAYAKGGEDTAWARWALEQGYDIFFEPAAAVHHTHGVGPLNFCRQWRYWQKTLKPLPFSQSELQKYRPDLFD